MLTRILAVAASAIAALIVFAPQGHAATRGDLPSEIRPSFPPGPFLKPRPPGRSPSPRMEPSPSAKSSPDKVVAGLRLDSYGSLPGGQVNVTGAGFTPFHTATLYWDHQDHVLGSANPDGSGSFQFTFVAPNDVLGNHVVCAAPPGACVGVDLLQAPAAPSGAAAPAAAGAAPRPLTSTAGSGSGGSWLLPLLGLLLVLGAGGGFLLHRYRPWQTVALAEMAQRATIKHRIGPSGG